MILMVRCVFSFRCRASTADSPDLGPENWDAWLHHRNLKILQDRVPERPPCDIVKAARENSRHINDISIF